MLTPYSTPQRLPANQRTRLHQFISMLVSRILLATSVPLLFAGCITHYGSPSKMVFADAAHPDEKTAIGFADMLWDGTSDGGIVGRGWQSREHETYMFFLNEPYPAFEPRIVRLTATGSGEFQFTLYLDRSLAPGPQSVGGRFVTFTAQGPLKARPTAGGIEVPLSHVTLVAGDGRKIIADGKLLARQVPHDQFSRDWDIYRTEIDGRKP